MGILTENFCRLTETDNCFHSLGAISVITSYKTIKNLTSSLKEMKEKYGNQGGLYHCVATTVIIDFCRTINFILKVYCYTKRSLS